MSLPDDYLNAFSQKDEGTVGTPDFTYYVMNIIQMIHVQVHAYGENGELTLCLSSTNPSEDPLHNDPEFRNRLIIKAQSEEVFLESDHGSIVYGGVYANGQSFIFGPVCIGTPDDNLRKLHAMRHDCTYAYLTKGDIPSFASALLTLYALSSGKALSLNNFIASTFLNSTILKSLSQKITDVTVMNLEGQPHHPLSMETRVLENIRLGDPENLMKSLDYPYPGRRGTLARDTLRSEKNIGIIDVTLSARSAISGGLEVETAYVIADAFILQVEDAKTPQEVFAIKTAAQLRFAQLVKEAMGEKEDYLKLNQPPELQDLRLDDGAPDTAEARREKIVNTIKNFVQRNISSKLSVEEISTYLKMSKSYLQHVFKEQEGISLMRYCHKEKIKIAEKLLKDSEYSITEITDMLNFCSKSHFTQSFKKETGFTPDAFRLKFKVTI